jgi:hypothetical protein
MTYGDAPAFEWDYVTSADDNGDATYQTVC